jgi:hypothetical protein
MSDDRDEPEAERLRLERWDGPAGDDTYAGLRVDVAAYAHLDPLATLRVLGERSGLPVGALARYVLARWASGGNEALLELGVSGVDHLARLVREAEEVGTDEARLAAYDGVRAVVGWLRAGLEAEELTEGADGTDGVGGTGGA